LVNSNLPPTTRISFLSVTSASAATIRIHKKLKIKTAASACHKDVARPSHGGPVFRLPSLLTLCDSIKLFSAVQAAFGPRKGLNLPAALDFVAFFLSEKRGRPTNLKEGAS
jgi:hypothetical protein